MHPYLKARGSEDLYIVIRIDDFTMQKHRGGFLPYNYPHGASGGGILWPSYGLAAKAAEYMAQMYAPNQYGVFRLTAIAETVAPQTIITEV